MSNLKGLLPFLIGCAFIYLFWPFLVGLIGIVLVIVAILIFLFWKNSKKVHIEHEFYDEGNQINNSSDNIIDVEYTERRIEDEQ